MCVSPPTTIRIYLYTFIKHGSQIIILKWSDYYMYAWGVEVGFRYQVFYTIFHLYIPSFSYCYCASDVYRFFFFGKYISKQIKKEIYIRVNILSKIIKGRRVWVNRFRKHFIITLIFRWLLISITSTEIHRLCAGVLIDSLVLFLFNEKKSRWFVSFRYFLYMKSFLPNL